MARRGFLGGFIRGVERFADRIGKLVAPSPPRREPPPREQPPREEPPRERVPRGTYRGIWRQQRGKGSFRKNVDVFHKMVDDIEPDEAERIDLWESFVRNINRNKKSDPYPRKSTFNPFWQESGLDPSTMDWQRWRIAMGFTGKNRSKTT